MRLILPKTLANSEATGMPLFFLAGPIRGGGDWQHQACLELQKRFSSEFCVASPCRYTEQHPLWQYRADGIETRFNRQLDWERHYLYKAALGSYQGCILFWLPCESRAQPHPGPEPYAMDTRGELGEWRGRMMQNKNIRLVIGAEEGFLGLSQIRRNFNEALECEFPIYETLEQTIDAAIRMAGIRKTL